MTHDALFFDSWLERFLAEETPRAKSLIVTVLGDSIAPHGAAVWLATLIRLLAPFGVNERLVRTSVFRLVEEQWLAAERSGRRSLYRLTPTALDQIAQVDARIYQRRHADWTGRWSLVLVPADTAAAEQRQRLRKALLWQGYAALAPGLYGHPGAEAPRLGPLTDGNAAELSVTVFEASTSAPSGDADQALVARHWPLEALALRYKALETRLASFDVALARNLDAPRAFALCTLLVHAYRRVALHDPQLPGVLLPHGWPGHSAFALCGRIYQRYRAAALEHLRASALADGMQLRALHAAYPARFTDSSTDPDGRAAAQ